MQARSYFPDHLGHQAQRESARIGTSSSALHSKRRMLVAGLGRVLNCYCEIICGHDRDAVWVRWGIDLPQGSVSGGLEEITERSSAANGTSTRGPSSLPSITPRKPSDALGD